MDKKRYKKELDLIHQEKIDVIAFSSTAEVDSFLKMFNSPTDYNHCPIACFAPYTAANATALGVDVSIVSQDYRSFAGFVDAIAAFFYSRVQ